MLLKTNEAFRKRTQNEPQLSAEMRELGPKLQLFDIAHARVRNWIAGDVAETEIARLGEARGTAGEYKNSENKAKKWLKTKHLTLFSGVDYARFAHQLAQILA